MAQVTAATEMGVTAAKLAATVHNHPTLSEVTGGAALDVLGRAIHKTRSS